MHKQAGGRGLRPRPVAAAGRAGLALSGVGVGPRLALDDVFPELSGGAGDAGAELGGEYARGQFRPVFGALEHRLEVGELRALGGGLFVREREHGLGLGELGEEELEHPEVTELGEGGDGFGEPLGRVAAGPFR